MAACHAEMCLNWTGQGCACIADEARKAITAIDEALTAAGYTVVKVTDLLGYVPIPDEQTLALTIASVWGDRGPGYTSEYDRCVATAVLALLRGEGQTNA